MEGENHFVVLSMLEGADLWHYVVANRDILWIALMDNETRIYMKGNYDDYIKTCCKIPACDGSYDLMDYMGLNYEYQ